MSAVQNVHKFGKGNIKVWDVTLTVAVGATTATCTSTDAFAGRVIKVELDPGTKFATSATIKGYEANTPLATGTRDHFIDYTVPASEVELVFYPMKAATTNAAVAMLYAAGGTAVPAGPPVVCDKLTLDLASAAAADCDPLRVRVYIEE